MPETNPPARPASEQAPPRTALIFDSISKSIQVVSVVVGVVISVLSFNETRKKEASAREAEAMKKQAEAAKPFLKLRQKLYLEAVQAAGVLANPEDHAEDEVKKARTRFRQLYVSELSLVEGIGVEQGMVDLAKAVDPKLTNFNDKQRAAFHLAHALRDSLVKSWNIKETLVDNPEH
jgi:hypothetical protein